jgi:hypothetical protein
MAAIPDAEAKCSNAATLAADELAECAAAAAPEPAASNAPDSTGS